MKIDLTSVMVDDQAKALAFYTDVLGFVKKTDTPAGGARLITLISPESPDIQLMLEPNAYPAAKVFQKALFDDGIPATSFGSSDIRAEHERLVARGVKFRKPPTSMGPVTIALFEDTCGNLIQLHQMA